MVSLEYELKFEKFEKEIKDEKGMDKKLKILFLNEYEEIIGDILNLKDELFIEQVKEGVSLLLEDFYTDGCLSDNLLSKIFEKNLNEIKNRYENDFSLINKVWSSYEKSSKRRQNNDIFLTGFRKHCIHTDDYLYHNCCTNSIEKSHFIIVKNNKEEIKFVVCQNCKKVYYSSFILARCNKCNIDYYTSLLTKDENPDLLLATWENYHCPQLINEKMKCIKCHEYFYIDMKTGMLNCSNKKCSFISKPTRILWTCSTCKTEFKSGAIPYNPLDIQVTKRLVSQTLLLKHKAHPNKMPCCKLNVFYTDFYHKKTCDGILYESELDDNKIIVCEKCKAINYYDRFSWTCPKCGKKFKDKLEIDSSNNDKNNSPIHKKMEHQITPRIFYRKDKDKDRDKEKDKEKSFRKERGKVIEDNMKLYTPNLKGYSRKRLDIKREKELKEFRLDDNVIEEDNDKDEKEKEEKEKEKKEKEEKEKEKKEKEDKEKEEKEKENEEIKSPRRKYWRMNFKNIHLNEDEEDKKKIKEKENEGNKNNKENKHINQENNEHGEDEENEMGNKIEKKESKEGGRRVFRRFRARDREEREKERKELEEKEEREKKEKEEKERKEKERKEREEKEKEEKEKEKEREKKERTEIRNKNTEENKDKENILSVRSSGRGWFRRRAELMGKENKENLSLKEKENDISPRKKRENSIISKDKEADYDNEEESEENNSIENNEDNVFLNFDHDDDEEENEREKEENPVEPDPLYLNYKFKRNKNKRKTKGMEIIGGDGDNEDIKKEEQKQKKKSIPQIKISMQKIPGISDHLFNHINKRMNKILNRCKIPVFNIEDYTFNKKLGEGSYAVIFSVYKNSDKSHKEIALKKIIARTLTEIDKYTKEFELVHSCIHPNIMKIYGICIRMLDPTTYSLYVLMELSKCDWDKEIKMHFMKKKNYTENELINILRQLTSALLFMQQNAKISHRDIKPQNVLLFDDGVYKIADFGEAKEAKISKEVNTLRGTELYMSPALYAGLKNDKNDVNHDPYKSDVFSLGFCFLYAATLNFNLLYQLRDIYNSKKINEVLQQQLNKKYSQTFVHILSCMMEIDESERFDFPHLVNYIEENYDKDGNLNNSEKSDEKGDENKELNHKGNRKIK